MSKKLLIIIGAVIIIGLAVFVVVLSRNSQTQPPAPPPIINPPPNAGTSTPPVPGPAVNPNNTISISTIDGGSIKTKDFINDPATVRDPVNAGYYYLGYHFTEGEGENIPYVIEYIKATDFFNIGLFKEPIAQSRKEAERYLMEHLGITQSEMCSLDYTVSVPYTVNESYTGMSLGFSFCPGSVFIPG